MKYLKLLFVVLLITAVAVVTVLAQDNDPSSNPDANACYAGGSMEGKCNQDTDGDGAVSQEEIDWAWTCGWYVIRYENALIGASAVPDTCQILLGYATNPVCIGLGATSILYNGIPGEDENWIFYYGDGNCHGYPFNYGFGNSSIISASSYSDAVDICLGLYDPLLNVEPLGNDLYICWGPFD